MGSRGPLPKPDGQRRRRNKPTVPTTELPRSGRPGRIPRCPYDLGSAGKAWWKWAWRTPQACAWDEVGHLYTVARRAQLEDDLRAIEASSLDLGLEELLAPEVLNSLKAVVSTLKRMAAGKLNVAREMRELDAQLGLTPYAMARLHLRIVDDEPAAPEEDGAAEDELGIDQFAGLRVVG